MNTIELLVRKDQLARVELRETPAIPLEEGQVRLGVESFALTANNITYAAFGEAMNYWRFYPAEEGWGRIPAWGFASVLESRHPEIAPGEKFYGYYPMSSSVVLLPHRLSAKGFMDGAEHRAQLHSVYNAYLRCSHDPFYTPQTEGAQALLRPLFITSWLIDDFLADNDFFAANADGHSTMLLSSASSKTAYGTAFQLAQRAGIEVVGLTSDANLGFCQGLGCYHRALSYNQLDQIAAATPCVYIDFAGNADLRRNIHSRFGNLRYSSSIGGTHVTQLGGAKDLPGPRATLFFAPAQIKKRSTEWGAERLEQKLLQAWHGFIVKACDATSPWLVFRHHRGPEAAKVAYLEVLSGNTDPRLGHVLSLAPGAA
ncbi:MAG: DUF2855 family protein [Burkholderiaceae bacterium]|nr:DUF2855 family protein [Sulfuritalea sp.]MCF8175047.1 DUF2855 family protein [Burkholderiaceae bacterium]